MSIDKQMELGVILFKIKTDLLGSVNIKAQNNAFYARSVIIYNKIAGNTLSRTQTHRIALNHNADQNCV